MTNEEAREWWRRGFKTYAFYNRMWHFIDPPWEWPPGVIPSCFSRPDAKFKKRHRFD